MKNSKGWGKIGHFYLRKVGGHCSILGNQRGVALLMTLLVVTLLVTLILGLDSTVRRDLRMVGNLRDDFKATYIAKSGVAAARALLKEDSKRSPKYDGFDEVWATPFPPYPLGDGLIVAEIGDEAGKFNVNTVVKFSGENKVKDEKRVEILMRLFELLNIDPNDAVEIGESIVDWIDSDNETLFGAEDGYYANLEQPYQTKNDFLTHLSELRQIRGMKEEIYQKVTPYLTVYPIPKKGGKNILINVNTADAVVIQAFSDEITSKKAQQIMENRSFDSDGDFKEDMNAIIGEGLFLGTDIGGGRSGLGFKEVFGFTSDFFSVHSQGIVNDIQKKVHAVVQRNGNPEILYWRVE
ncbi:MAG TPA: type II secretion system minor pseudopilin GspK [Nitrospiria bacterium]